MDVVLIEGYSDSGKSTLCRCLSGIGNARHNHPNCANVLSLDWPNPNQRHETLILSGSLNEGVANGHGILPAAVGPLLDDYALACNAAKAILCVSATARRRSPIWGAQVYANYLTANQGAFQSNAVPHPVTHVVSLYAQNAALLPLFAMAVAQGIQAQQFLPAPNITRNALASQVRPFINLL